MNPAGFWHDHVKTIDPENFRGDMQYLQQSGYDAAKMLAHVRAKGYGPTLDALDEDRAFGCVATEIDGKLYSRDLLDSVLEIEFMRKIFGKSLERVRIVDIGAGYGRLAHRLLTLYPHPVVVCLDGVELSTEICRRYLESRKTPALAFSERTLAHGFQFDLAVNIHSWSECTRADIRGWLDWIVAEKIPRLFVVPHTPEFYSYENGTGAPFYEDILAHGFVETMREFDPNVQHSPMVMFEARS